MAYWWLSQGDTFAYSRADGLLWAPADDVFHHRNLDEVRPGDVFVCNRNKRFPAIAIAQSPRFPARFPDGWPKSSNWVGVGRSIKVDYLDFANPVRLEDVDEALRRSISAPGVRYAPLDSALSPNQGYLFRLSAAFGEEVLRLAGLENDASDAIDAAISNSAGTSTQRSALIQARIGQGKFREDLIAYWQGRCALTGLAIQSLLRASHVKPWRASDNTERVDPYNGLLLCPNYDAAFDKFLISFADDSRILISNALDAAAIQCLGIDVNARVQPDKKHLVYVSAHREMFNSLNATQQAA